MLTFRYSKFVVGGQEVIEVDLINMVRIVDGTDKLADMRAASCL